MTRVAAPPTPLRGGHGDGLRRNAGSGYTVWIARLAARPDPGLDIRDVPTPRPDMTPDMIRSTNRYPLLAGGLALLAALSAQAQTPAGSAEKGKQLTYTCQGCHGVTGYKNAYPTYSVPKITGQSAEYIANALLEYRKGTRKHPTMQAQAQSFSEQDIADIAAYLSSLKK